MPAGVFIRDGGRLQVSLYFLGQCCFGIGRRVTLTNLSHFWCLRCYSEWIQGHIWFRSEDGDGLGPCHHEYGQAAAKVKVEKICAQIREDIVTLQPCFDQDTFTAAKTLFQNKWESVEELGVSNFIEYFRSSWLDSNKTWYVCYALGLPSTNNGREAKFRLEQLKGRCSKEISALCKRSQKQTTARDERKHIEKNEKENFDALAATLQTYSKCAMSRKLYDRILSIKSASDARKAYSLSYVEALSFSLNVNPFRRHSRQLHFQYNREGDHIAEAVNQHIQKSSTFRERLPHFKVWTEAYEWASSKVWSVKDADIIYVETSSSPAENHASLEAIIKVYKLCHKQGRSERKDVNVWVQGTWTSFQDFVKWRSAVWNTSSDENCTCPSFLKASSW